MAPKKPMKSDPVDPLAEISRTSGFFPDDPPEVVRAWREYVDAYRRDRLRAKGKRDIKITWVTEIEWRRYCDVVAQAHAEGRPPFEQLNPHSTRPVLFVSEPKNEW